MKVTPAISVYLLLVLGILLLTPTLDYTDQTLPTALFITARTALLILASLLPILTLIKIMKRKDTSMFLLSNFWLSALALFSLMPMLEAVFTLIPMSNHTNQSLASKTWQLYYGNKSVLLQDPSTEVRASGAARKQIVFIGDSFTQGAGLKSISMRYSDLLEESLRDCADVFNFGRDGYSTTEELEVINGLIDFPDIMVLQYFFNDPDMICHEALGWYPELDVYAELPYVARTVITRSYLANFIFFRTYDFPMMDSYMRFFTDCFRDQKAIKMYAQQVDSIVDYCQNNEITLLVLVISHPVQPESTAPQDRIVQKMYENRGVTVIMADSVLNQLPLSQRIISNQDLHLSELGNQQIADLLYPILRSQCDD